GRLEADALEMSRLAEALGRRFEARAFLSLAARRQPADPEIRAALARAGRAPSAIDAPGQTLADLLAAALGPAHAPIPHPTARPTLPSPGPPPRGGASRPNSATTPRRPAWRSSWTTVSRPSTSSPRWPAGAWACSTTTATAGSTSTSSRAVASRPTRPGPRAAI